MNKKPKYYIVEASALPEVFVKVAEAKRLLSTGEAKTVNQATKMMDISRSAFYKYRDSVSPFDKKTMSRAVTFQFLLHDEPGVLSAILTAFAEQDVNLLTITSIVPSYGTALVTTTAEISDMESGLEDLLGHMGSIPGVIKAEILAG
jgi:chorismate mutase